MDITEDLIEITEDKITFFCNNPIGTIFTSRYRESLMPKEGEEIHFYNRRNIPITQLTSRPQVYKVLRIARDLYKTGVVHVWVYVKKI